MEIVVFVCNFLGNIRGHTHRNQNTVVATNC